MQVFDASSMIYAWDNYPERQMPGLWKWLATQIASGNIQMSRVAFDETSHKFPDCAKWLRNQGITLLPVDNSTLQEASRIEALLGVHNGNYHPKGVGENDLIIIATAHIHNAELVSDENEQVRLPQDLKKYKIPAVCQINRANVPCINFIRYIKRSGVIF